MTSEVVVMNRAGVALAADSAVTVEMGDSQRVRHSALKLFRLSTHRPVGVMVYNNASLLGVPMETIIKLFRRHLGKEAYGTLREYGDALVQYLDGNDALFPRDVQDRYFLQAVETEYLRIWEELSNEFVERGVYGDGDGKADVAKDVIAKRLEFWRSQQDADYFKDVCARDVVGRISGGVNDVVLRVFRGSGGAVGAEGGTMLWEIANHIGREGPLPAGCVLGPCHRGIRRRGTLPGGPAHRDRGRVRRQAESPAARRRRRDRGSPLRRNGFRVQGHGGTVPGRDLRELRGGISQTRRPSFESFRYGRWRRSRSSIAKNGNAAAEAVQRMAADRAHGSSNGTGATRIRAEVAEDRPCGGSADDQRARASRGDARRPPPARSSNRCLWIAKRSAAGPVDVAVISKGDGFIWINRKHYFRKELNDHYFRNYQDDDEDKAGDDQGRRAERRTQPMTNEKGPGALAVSQCGAAGQD